MDRPLGLAELLHACEPLSEVAVLSETVVVGGQLEQLDLSDHLELLRAESRRKGRYCTTVGKRFRDATVNSRYQQSIQDNKHAITFLLFSKLIRPPCKRRQEDFQVTPAKRTQANNNRGI